MTNALDNLRALLVAATGDRSKFQGARYPSGKHAAGRAPKSVKGRAAGRAFVKRHGGAA